MVVFYAVFFYGEWAIDKVPFIFLFYFFTLQYCIGFAIYQHESAMGIHVFHLKITNYECVICALCWWLILVEGNCF